MGQDKEALTRRSTKGSALSLPSAEKVAKLLGWGPEQTPLKYLLRFVPGGVDTFMSILQASPEPNVMRLVKAYVDLTASERNETSLEELCGTCDVTPGILIQEFSREAFSLGGDMSRAIAAMAQVPIMAASVALASKPTRDGMHERKMHFQANKFLPMKKGTFIMDRPTFNNNPGGPAAPTGAELAGVEDFASVTRRIADLARGTDVAVTDVSPLSDDE